jgi:hypothetical protein
VAEAPGFALVSAVDWPVTGVATSSKESRPNRQRDAGREAEFGEGKTLMSSLYAAFAAS